MWKHACMASRDLSLPFSKTALSGFLDSAKQVLQPGREHDGPLQWGEAACGFSRGSLPAATPGSFSFTCPGQNQSQEHARAPGTALGNIGPQSQKTRSHSFPISEEKQACLQPTLP